MVEQTETPSRDPRTLVSEVTPVARKLRFNFATINETTISEKKREYGKRKRGEDQALDYEVESILATESSTKEIRGTKDPHGIRSPKEGEETNIPAVAEEITEEEEEGGRTGIKCAKP